MPLHCQHPKWAGRFSLSKELYIDIGRGVNEASVSSAVASDAQRAGANIVHVCDVGVCDVGESNVLF